MRETTITETNKKYKVPTHTTRIVAGLFCQPGHYVTLDIRTPHHINCFVGRCCQIGCVGKNKGVGKIPSIKMLVAAQKRHDGMVTLQVVLIDNDFFVIYINHCESIPNFYK